MSNPIQIRLFLGYLLQGEIAIHLQQTSQENRQKWKLEKIFESAYCNDKEYIGFFTEELPTYKSLKRIEEKIKTQLQLYCPKLNLDKQKIQLFPQIFLS
ncbi:hypothetical protein [Candidatus Protochlamydia amoebophila]|uniref:hypothetical protein n=1 Tax=Candidatus Protochlamydia amoebophila TaxID=362787 RepID=UPI001BC96E48|nr:hypothetical protein [Candidatus Protochlamydia amoebophila]